MLGGLEASIRDLRVRRVCGALWSAFLGWIGIALIGNLAGVPVTNWSTWLVVGSIAAVLLIACAAELIGGSRTGSDEAIDQEHRIRDGANARYHARTRR